MSATFLAFDVDAIAAYVFGAVSPTEVMGASRLIEQFCGKAEELSSQRGGTVVFQGGGSGVVEIDDAKAGELGRALRDELAKLTERAATCTIVSTPASEDFASCWARLTARMARAKRERGLRREMGVNLPKGLPPSQVCTSCGREPGDAEMWHDRPIGSQCRARVKAAVPVVTLADRAVRVTRNLEEMVRSSDDVEREILATVYLDADGLGTRLQAARSSEGLRRLASSLRHGIHAAVAATVQGTDLDGKVVLPVVGGDDVVLVCEARRALEVLAALWEHLDEALADVDPEAPLRFSAGISFGPLRAPLRVHFDLARRALKEAKNKARTVAAKANGPTVGPTEPYVQLRSFAPLAGHRPDVPLFGRALPRSAFADVSRLIDGIRSLPNSQVTGLRRDIDEPVGVLRQLHLDYRAARNEECSRFCAEAGLVADRFDLPLDAVLRGTLDLDPVVR